ncbi:MAG: PH domain-containing protein [Halobacillus sp.]
MMYEPKRLHPVSAVINFVKGLKDSALPIIALIFLNGNIFSGGVEWMPLLITVGFLLLVLGGGVIRWLRFTYRVEQGELRIEHGLILRKKRYIPFHRIQSLDFSEGIFHRPFNLVKVSIETAGSSDLQKAEAELTAIKREDADELETIISREKNKRTIEEEGIEEDRVVSSREKVYEMKMKDIVVMAVTSGGAGVVLSGVGVFASQLTEVLPLDTIYSEFLAWLRIGVLVVAFAAFVILLIAYGISILLTIFRYANFSVFLDADDLVITRGWLEKKQMTIPLNRIQGLRIDENLIRQPLGYASVTLVSAGGAMQQGAEHQLRLLPLIKKKEIENVLHQMISDYELDVEWNRPPTRSKRRYILRHSWFAWVAVIPLSIFLFPYGLLAILAALAFTGIGFLAYKDAGWNLSDQQLTLKSRFINKQTFVMKRKRIQSAAVTQTILQKRVDLESIRVTLKSGVGGAVARCLYLDQQDTRQMMDWYRPNDTVEKRSDL